MPKSLIQQKQERREWENFILSEQIGRLFRLADYKNENKFTPIINEMQTIIDNNIFKNKNNL